MTTSWRWAFIVTIMLSDAVYLGAVKTAKYGFWHLRDWLRARLY